MGTPENFSVSQNSYNGFNLPKISHVARSNSLRCSSPPRALNREPNIPAAVQEESLQFSTHAQPYPLIHQVDTRKNSQNINNNNNISVLTPISTAAIFSAKSSETNKTNGGFGNLTAQATPNSSNQQQTPAPLGPLQLQQHHFQQHLQQQKQLEQNSQPGMRHPQDIANNNPQRGSVTSSVNSTGLHSSVGLNGKQEQRLTHEQFRAALQMVVSPNGDPQKNLENFIKIGEGSTGTVWIAVEKNTSKILSSKNVKF